MKDHIKISLKQQLFDFSPIPPKIDKKPVPVNRNAHFAKVRGALQNAIFEAEKSALMFDGKLDAIDIPHNIVLTFKENIDINDRLVIKSLDSHGMTLLSVNKIDDRYVANVSVPNNKIEKLKELVDDYGNKVQGKKTHLKIRLW